MSLPKSRAVQCEIYLYCQVASLIVIISLAWFPIKNKDNGQTDNIATGNDSSQHFMTFNPKNYRYKPKEQCKNKTEYLPSSALLQSCLDDSFLIGNSTVKRFLSHGENPVGRAWKDFLVGFKILRSWKRTTVGTLFHGNHRALYHFTLCRCQRLQHFVNVNRIAVVIMRRLFRWCVFGHSPYLIAFIDSFRHSPTRFQSLLISRTKLPLIYLSKRTYPPLTLPRLPMPCSTG